LTAAAKGKIVASRARGKFDLQVDGMGDFVALSVGRGVFFRPLKRAARGMTHYVPRLAPGATVLRPLKRAGFPPAQAEPGQAARAHREAAFLARAGRSGWRYNSSASTLGIGDAGYVDLA
jgi:hypothetical protein